MTKSPPKHKTPRQFPQNSWVLDLVKSWFFGISSKKFIKKILKSSKKYAILQNPKKFTKPQNFPRNFFDFFFEKNSKIIEKMMQFYTPD